MNDPIYQKKYRLEHKKKLREYNLKYKLVNKQQLKQDRNFYRKKPKVEYKIKKQVWQNKLKSRYGLSPEQYFDMIEKQAERCAICKQIKKLNVDHCHATNKVRGMLCGECNRGLGLFKDDVILLANAIQYLKTKKIEW